MKYYSFLFILILGMAAFTSCSDGNNPVDPPESSLEVTEVFGAVENEERSIIAAYEVTIDPDAFVVELNPLREAEGHFNLTGFIPGVLAITGYGLDPDYNNSFYADMTLTHPYPGSGIDAFDPRLIAIVPANDGVSYYFPIFNIVANNSVVRNPDGYTPLWDSVAPSIVGNNNPYLSYFKDQPNRIWSSTGETSETRRMYLNLAGFGGPLTYTLVVDVNTGFPSPPTPGTDNAPEPVDCDAVVYQGLTPDGGFAFMDVTFLDWQGYEDIK